MAKAPVKREGATMAENDVFLDVICLLLASILLSPLPIGAGVLHHFARTEVIDFITTDSALKLSAMTAVVYVYSTLRMGYVLLSLFMRYKHHNSAIKRNVAPPKIRQKAKRQ